MFREIARFEFTFQVRNPVFGVAAAILFLFAFASMVSGDIRFTGGGDVERNAPFAIVTAHLVLTIVFMFATAAFVSNAVIRDDETGFAPLIRTTRVRRFDYLSGRFAGAFAAAALAFAAVPLAMWLGSLWPGTGITLSNDLSAYLFAYFVIALPNILLTSATFFFLATVTRSMLGTFLGVIGFLVLYSTAFALAPDQAQARSLFALLEPFGLAAFLDATRYWTAAERNTLMPALQGPLLLNRVIWLSFAAALLALLHVTFRFHDRATSGRKEDRRLAGESRTVKPVNASLAKSRFNAFTPCSQFLAQLRLDVSHVLGSPAFLVLLAVYVVASAANLAGAGSFHGAPAVPVTRVMILALRDTFTFITFAVAIFYAGELVWRDRDRKFNEIVDAAPVPDLANMLAKTAAVSCVLVATLLIGVATAIVIQLTGGHTDIELARYFSWHVLPRTIDLILLAVFAVFVHAVCPGKHAGWGILVIWLMVTLLADRLGPEHNLLVYGALPAEPLSDMNSASLHLEAAWWFRLYWGAFAVLLMVGAHLLWRRGTGQRFSQRLRRAPSRLKGVTGMTAGAAAIVFLATGAWIFHNTNIINDYRSGADDEQLLAEYEKRFLQYERLAQPSIRHIELDVSLFPAEKRAVTRGHYRLVNLTDEVIRDVHVRNISLVLEVLDMKLPGARLVRHDEAFGYRVFRLEEPMLPGDTRELLFETRRWQRGFRNDSQDARLVRNGTFLDTEDLAPVIGMDRDVLLRDRETRRRHGLPPTLRPPALGDADAKRKGPSWATADITVSTIASQVPVAPGHKVSERVENGRRIARFVSESPIRPAFSIQSAAYAERHREHEGIDLAVFHHPDHAWNVERMLDALEASLDYYQENFGAYPFEQVRIVEFPAYADFAQAFAGTIPYSESVGFTADLSAENALDYVTFGVAHELAHQWWAHQLVGAEMQGREMLSETLAQYAALMVIRKLQGESGVRRFLAYERDRYLGGRAEAVEPELPLARVEAQPYIYYHKGALAMYQLQERLGEAAVNRALRRLLERYRFKPAPYPDTRDLIGLFRDEAGSAEDQALITELFEQVVIYDLRVESPVATRRDDGQWDVAVPVTARKFMTDEHGREQELPLDGNVPLGLFHVPPDSPSFEESEVLLMERRVLESGRQTFHFITAEPPSYASVDPYGVLVDREPRDNTEQVAAQQ